MRTHNQASIYLQMSLKTFRTAYGLPGGWSMAPRPTTPATPKGVVTRAVALLLRVLGVVNTPLVVVDDWLYNSNNLIMTLAFDV